MTRMSKQVMINNFSRLQPTMKTLNVRFDSNVAASIMQQDPGVALNVLHQLKNVSALHARASRK